MQRLNILNSNVTNDLEDGGAQPVSFWGDNQHMVSLVRLPNT